MTTQSSDSDAAVRTPPVDVAITDAQLDAPCALTIVKWQGSVRCAYLNDYRIAGDKPWGGGDTLKEWNGITLREIVRAFPALQRALAIDYLGNRAAIAKAQP